MSQKTLVFNASSCSLMWQFVPNGGKSYIRTILKVHGFSKYINH